MNVQEDVSYEVALRLIEISPGICCVLGPGGRIEYANSLAERAFEYAQEELAGQSILELLHPDDRAEFREAMNDSASASRRECQARLRTPGGDYRRLQWTLVPAGSRTFGSARVCCGSDDAKARDRDDRFRMLVDGVKDFAIFLLDPAGKVASWNPGAERILQYPESEILGQDVNVLFTAEDHARGEAALELRTAIREGQAEVERWHVRKDGTRFLANGTTTALCAPEGELRGFVKVIRDITERRNKDEALHEAQMVQSIGVLAGGIAHDFNNLLTGIIGSASLAVQDLPWDIPARRLMEDVITAGQRAADLTQQLLAYAGKGRYTVGSVDLSDAVAGMVHALRPSVPKTVRIELDLTEHLPSIEADVRQVQRIACNLLINAVEAVEGGGEIRVSTGRLLLGSEHGIDSLRHPLAPGEYVFLQVEDSGTGMDEHVKARIFDPFYTTKFTGRGLGLAAVAGFVRAHQGAIELVTAPGEGSKFRVMLPVARRVLEPNAVPLHRDVPAGSGVPDQPAQH